MASNSSELIAKLRKFESCVLNFATGKEITYEQYEQERSDILAEPDLIPLLPDWISKCRYGSKFWSFIKEKSDTYQGRREFIRDSIGMVIESIESGGDKPVTISMNAVLKNCNSETVDSIWKKIHQRSHSDIPGAITLSRSLVESTCKYILDRLEELYSNNDDLPKLYKKTAKRINLSPEQHNEQIFKKILSGCTSAVSGLAYLRNEYGDAHGKGKVSYSPDKRHSDLAINLAGSISSFLIATYEAGNKD